MQDVIIQFVIIAAFAVGVGTLSSMIGIGGGILNTPLLIILFFLSEQTAPATALVAAFFVAVASTIVYSRQKPRPIIVKAGIFMAIATVPGSLIGVMLREMITDVLVLRLIFGVSLFPIAIKMLFAKKRAKSDDVASFKFSNISRQRIVLSLFGGFIGGVSAGLLGIGGGAVVVPVLTSLMGLPIHAAVATSMFIMMFTASAGTARNYVGGYIDPFYAITLGVGMVIGAQIGPRLACRVNAVQLKQVFGLVLVFPLVKMMTLGQMWLDPTDTSFAMATLGDFLIWLIIVVPIGLLRLYQIRKVKKDSVIEPCDLPSPE
jgi:uncharacterized membrane protein YfcA